jgi:hypothetical protein
MTQNLLHQAPTSAAPQSIPLAEIALILRNDIGRVSGAALAELLEVFTDDEGDVLFGWLFDPEVIAQDAEGLAEICWNITESSYEGRDHALAYLAFNLKLLAQRIRTNPAGGTAMAAGRYSVQLRGPSRAVV